MKKLFVIYQKYDKLHFLTGLTVLLSLNITFNFKLFRSEEMYTKSCAISLRWAKKKYLDLGFPNHGSYNFKSDAIRVCGKYFRTFQRWQIKKVIFICHRYFSSRASLLELLYSSFSTRACVTDLRHCQRNNLSSCKAHRPNWLRHKRSILRVPTSSNRCLSSFCSQSKGILCHLALSRHS